MFVLLMQINDDTINCFKTCATLQEKAKEPVVPAASRAASLNKKNERK